MPAYMLSMHLMRRFDLEQAAQAAGWQQALMGSAPHVPESEQYGVGSCVWRSQRPFHPQRLWERVLERNELPPVLRSKAGLPHTPLTLANACCLLLAGSAAGVPGRARPDGCRGSSGCPTDQRWRSSGPRLEAHGASPTTAAGWTLSRLHSRAGWRALHRRLRNQCSASLMSVAHQMQRPLGQGNRT